MPGAAPPTPNSQAGAVIHRRLVSLPTRAETSGADWCAAKIVSGRLVDTVCSQVTPAVIGSLCTSRPGWIDSRVRVTLLMAAGSFFRSGSVGAIVDDPRLN